MDRSGSMYQRHKILGTFGTNRFSEQKSAVPMFRAEPKKGADGTTRNPSRGKAFQPLRSNVPTKYIKDKNIKYIGYIYIIYQLYINKENPGSWNGKRRWIYERKRH